MTTMVLTLIISFSALSQIGPISPCVDCEDFSKRTEPFNGTWYNPEQSGTGFSIDVQNGKLFGVYYGYDLQGKAIWLTFVDDLTPSDDANIMWTIDAELTQFENGNSFNTEYTSPETTDYTSKIHIDFTQKNHAIFSVNDGQQQNIVPIIFGVSGSVDFPEKTTYIFPELAGMWTFVYHFKSISGIVPPEPFSIVSETLVIRNKRIVNENNDGIDDVVYGLNSYSSFPENIRVGNIVCRTELINEIIQGPSCEFIDNRGLFGDIENKPRYKMSVGGLGAFRLFGEHEDGHTFEAIKINSKRYNF